MNCHMQPERFSVSLPDPIFRGPWKKGCPSGRIISAGGRVCAVGMMFLALMAMAGCKPKPAAVPPAAPQVDAETNVAPSVTQAETASDASAPPAVIPVANGEPDLGALSHSVLRWAVAHQRRPASFEEFAADPGVQIPPAPPGKKYKMERTMHVVLVNQ